MTAMNHACDSAKHRMLANTHTETSIQIVSAAVEQLAASTDVVDFFRLGRLSADKTWPVLVKLRTVWDKRCILRKCLNLTHYTERAIFTAANEPIDVRRKNSLDRLSIALKLSVLLMEFCLLTVMRCFH